MKFPTVSGSNLLRQKLTLPDDFQGKLNLVFVPFYQWHQMEVNSWLPFLQKQEYENKDLTHYELPTIQERNRLSQMFINEGMRAGIPDTTTREHTITLYLDKASFRHALDMPDEDHTYVLLVDHQGNILYRTRGAFSFASGELLQQMIRQFSETPVAA